MYFVETGVVSACANTLTTKTLLRRFLARLSLSLLKSSTRTRYNVLQLQISSRHEYMSTIMNEYGIIILLMIYAPAISAATNFPDCNVNVADLWIQSTETCHMPPGEHSFYRLLRVITCYIMYYYVSTVPTHAVG